MAFGTITSTSNTFGSVDGTATGVVPGTLTGSVGVPGPAGPGVPAGGLEGQIIVKASETDYDTVWVDNAAETLTATVRNETGATLTKGTVVYINGAAGNKATVTKASAATESGSSKTFAILKDDIPNNQNGTAVTVGLLKGVDTSAFSPGANLWLSTTAGQITQTMPTSPNHAVFLGNAVRIHANQGEIEVRIQNGLELGELHDVLIHDVANGQVLKYDSAQGLWVNGTDSAGVAWGGITGTLSDQTDLQTALDAKYDASNPSGFITSSALSPYLTTASASATYQTLSGMADYLSKAGNLSGLASVSTARDNLGLGSLSTPTFAGVTVQGSGSNVANLTPTSISLTHATSGSFVIQPSVGITFPDATVQTTAYPGPPGATTWGSITGTLSSQTDLQTALDGKYSTSNPAGYITSSALTGYATESFVTSQGYITSSALAGYATESWVTAGFYPLSSNPAGYLTSASLSGYATESWVTSELGSYLTTSAAASTYLTQSNAASTYQTIAGMSSYLTTATAASTYAPLASPALTGNPTAPTPATADNDTSIATTAFVKAQGYLTSAPVTSVAGKTGAVTLVVGDVSGAAPLASPTFTGTPAAPTATAGTNTTQIATTAFVTAGLNLKANLASPTFTGTPAAPTASAGTSTTQLATTAFVTTADNLKANLASPALTGTPTAPTATAGTNTTQIATTAFVTAAVPTFATTAEINSPAATNKVVSPWDVVRMITNRAVFDTQSSSPTFATSGTGAEAYKATNDRVTILRTPNAGVGGYGQMIYETTASQVGVYAAQRGANIISKDYSKKIWMSGTTMFSSLGDSNTVTYCMMGGRNTITSGNPTLQGFGWKLVGGGTALKLITYGWTGSALAVTETTSSFTPVLNQTFDWLLLNEGTGAGGASSTCKLYVNDVLVASGINAPGGANVNFNYFFQSLESTASAASPMGLVSLPVKFWWSRS